MSKRISAVVAGATGYSGFELIKMLLRHRHIDLVGVYASPNSEPTPISSVHPQLTGLTNMICKPFDESEVSKADLVFLATPNEFSHEVAPRLLDAGATVVDISGAYRLRDASLYPKYYGFEHTRHDLLSSAIYGLTEFVRKDLGGAKLIANPGCYPTSIQIPLLPLLNEGMISLQQPVICDSKSGTSGAGKGLSSGTHFIEVNESFKAYNIFKHRHAPEIAQGLNLKNDTNQIIFTPHLLPINRGILSTIYFKVNGKVSRKDILNVWKTAFSGSTFVRIFDSDHLPEIKFVANTPFCDIGCNVDESSGQVVIVSAIDNLLKGASSQALQNANIAFGFDEGEGLL